MPDKMTIDVPAKSALPTGYNFVTLFGKCKNDGTAKFPGLPCFKPQNKPTQPKAKPEPPVYVGVGYECTKTGRQCSAANCPLVTSR